MTINSQNRVGIWVVGDRQVSLFSEQRSGRLSYSTDREGSSKTPLQVALYDPAYAVNLTAMFRSTIRKNLESGDPNSDCFVPKLCTKVLGQFPLQVALFGRMLNPEGRVAGDFRGMHWGIYHLSERTEETFDAQNDPIAREFIRRAPTTDSPHLEIATDPQGKPVLDKRGLTVMREVQDAPDHYAMTAYAKRFRVIVEHAGVSLRCERAWYEKGEQSCRRILTEYLSNPEEGPALETIRQLCLAADQLVEPPAEEDLVYFREVVKQLDLLPRTDQEKIFGNLERFYPTVYSIIFKEIQGGGIDEAVENGYASIVEILQRGVIGQDRAVEVLATALASQKNEDNAKFLFVGPTGVGKTELAKVASRIKEGRFVVFNMEHYRDSVSFNKMFGSSAGYVGSMDKPHFSKEVDKYASSASEGAEDTLERTVKDVIILFDEIEKAHTNLKQSLLTLLDVGHVSIQYTSERKNLSIKYIFSRSIFIGTSNLYKNEIVQDLKSGIASDEIEKHFVKLNETRPCEGSFTPEFLGRMKVVPFGPIPKGETYQRLLQCKLPSLLEALAADVQCYSVEVADMPAVLNLLEATLYGEGVAIRVVSDYFRLNIKNAIFKQKDWGNLKRKKLLIMPFAPTKLGIKCVECIHGKAGKEYGIVPI